MVQAQKPMHLVVAGGASSAVINSLAEESGSGLVRKATLVGNATDIGWLVKQAGVERGVFEIVDTGDDDLDCARESVMIARSSGIDVLVKGNIQSALLIRQLLNSEVGIRSGMLLSNVTVFETDSYHKLFAITDNAIVPEPDIGQKRQIIENTGPLFSALRVATPKVALVAASEKPTDSLPATNDAVRLKEIFLTNELPFQIDGPFGYDVCMSSEAATAKGLGDSPVAGDPDVLLFHNLEAANAVGKAIKLHGRAASGGLLLGCDIPIMFNSRSDGSDRRRNSLLLACAMARKRNA